MIALIDNYDSFTYNIYQEISLLTDESVRVFRNDKIDLEELIKLEPGTLIISPGPGRPSEAGISLAAVKYFSGKIPILGVCLGHQVIAECFGGEIVQADRIVHGKVEPISLDGCGLFRNLPATAEFTRYHSLAAKRSSLPDCLEITAESSDKEIMGIRHKEFPVEGVQFHPESIGCLDAGRLILKNFLRYKLKPLDKKALLGKIQDGKDLTFDEASYFMDELTEGSLDPAFTAAVFSALNCKGITAEEIAGCAAVLKKKKLPVTASSPVLDTCGTGGDGKHTFNISSLAALMAAAAGVKVAKHGNRAVSSKSGSADFYRELGIRYQFSPDQSEELLNREGFAFLFAPLFHRAMAYAAPVRREMGVKTIMNLLGPLVNPAEAEYQLIGVYSDELCPIMAKAAKITGALRVMTVHSSDGLDEISPAAPSRLFMIDEKGIETDTIFNPAENGITGYSVNDLRGGGAEENAETAWRIINGEGSEAIKTACLLNAGAALMLAGDAGSIMEGYQTVSRLLAEGKVKGKVRSLITAGTLMEKENE